MRKTRDYGNVDMDDLFDGDAIDDWLKLKEGEEIAPKSHQALVDHVKENRNETALQQFLNQEDVYVLDATFSHFLKYVDYLREKGAKDRTIENRLSESSAFYNDLMEFGQTDSNPAGLALQHVPLDTESPDRNHITIEEMAGYIKSIPDPQMRCYAVQSAKLGTRTGINIATDLHCLNLDHPNYYELLDELDITLIDEVRDRPDSLFVYGNFNGGDEVAGEVRTTGSRRSFPAVLPIDLELKHAMLEWLAIRPRTYRSPHPLYTTCRADSNGEYGRINQSSVYWHLIDKYGVNYGITDEETNREDFDLHYFRHFFGTQMKRHYADHDGWLDRDLIKYFRGDAGLESIDIYQHDKWGVHTRDAYLENIYSFGLYE